jgi:hypothetical protein
MNGDTSKLIQRLAEQIEPVRPLPVPLIRTAKWLIISAPYVALVALLMTPRQDLLLKLSESRYVVEQLSALAVAFAAATAAFAATVPGYDRKIFLPILPLSLWLATLGHGCIQDWLHNGRDGLAIRPDWMCLPAIALIGALPAVTMAVMLRRGAPLRPHLTSALGGLAAAGLGSFGLRLTESQDASVMVFVWQVGSVVVLSALAASVGNYLLNWRSITGASENAVQ